MTDCAEVRELLGGSVLGALEPDEQAVVRRHLESCPRCRREHAELVGLPALLALLDPSDPAPEAPPPALEEAVLDRFARERRGLGRRRSAARRRPALGAAAAAVVLAVAALALTVVLRTSDEESAFGHVYLRGAGGAWAKAELRAARAGTDVRLSAAGLPNDRSVVYELWCVTDAGRWISGGTFRADRRGAARASLTSAARPGDYELMLITRRGEGRRASRVLSGRVAY